VEALVLYQTAKSVSVMYRVLYSDGERHCNIGLTASSQAGTGVVHRLNRWNHRQCDRRCSVARGRLWRSLLCRLQG